MLAVIRTDIANFAPSIESVSIAWEPHPRGYKSLRLDVFDSANLRVYSQTWDCTKEPKPVISWNGCLDENADLRTEPWATPLRSPYRIELDGTLEPLEPPQRPENIAISWPTKEKIPCHAESEPSSEFSKLVQDVIPETPIGKPIQVEVLYASVTLLLCPWDEKFLAGGEWKDKGAFIGAKLNALGYYAGVPGASSEDLERAYRRFHWNHPTLCLAPLDLESIPGEVVKSPPLFPVFTFAEGKPISELTSVPAAGDVKNPFRIHVEAIGFEADYSADGAEFEMQYVKSKTRRQKWEWEPRRLNRPILPLLVVVKLMNSAGKAVDAPEAVGAVPIRWRAEEPDIETTPLRDERRSWSEPKSFVNHIHSEVKGRQGTQNCPQPLGGIRTDKWWSDAWLPGGVIPGFDLKPVPDPGAMENQCSVDPDRRPIRGCACAYFQPSYIGGDTYNLKAWIDFEGLTRARELALSHAKVNLVYKTAPIQIWRRVRLSAILGWPLRKDPSSLASRARKEFANAFVDLDTSDMIVASAADVLTQEDYAAFLEHVWNAMGKSVSSARTAGIESVISPLLPRDAPFQIGPKDGWTHPYFPKDKVRALDTLLEVLKAIRQRGKLAFDFCEEMQGPAEEGKISDAEALFLNEVSKFSGKLLTEQFQKGRTIPPAAVLSRKFRQRLAANPRFRPGIIVMDYAVPEIVNLGGRLTEPVAATFSVGMEDLFAVTDQNVPGAAWYIFTHEVAHCLLLRHHENAPDVNVEDHDPGDHGCMMSYPSDLMSAVAGPWPHQVAAKYNPSFCGRCLFKLRGWNIHSSTLWPVADPFRRVIGYFDMADKKIKGMDEMDVVDVAVSGVPKVTMASDSFFPNTNLELWADFVRGCDVYHHVTHGNVYCKSHSRRVVSLNLIRPSYPVCCIEGKARKGFDEGERDADGRFARIQDSSACRKAKTEWYLKQCTLDETTSYFGSTRAHNLEGVFQWAGSLDEDTTNDVMFRPDDIRRSLGKAGPKLLAFLSCCLVGWDREMAQAFLDCGTAYVIGFRSRYATNNALPFTKLFYTEWAKTGMAGGAIEVSFRAAAMRYPQAEPVLFTADKWIRCTATSDGAMVVYANAQDYAQALGVNFRIGPRWTGKVPPEFLDPSFHE
jgi:hypothetical protein